MAQSPRVSPNRRRSIAVLNRDTTNAYAIRRRRAHSIAPGDKLSPLTRSRRSLGPRKSILKQISRDDDETQTMELTTVQSSLSRRVSWAKDTHYRVFKKPIKKDHNNSISTQLSPSVQSPDQATLALNPVNDENMYPGSDDFSRFRRRSSFRRSFGTDIGAGEQSMELDMDDTAPTPFTLLQGEDRFTSEENSNEFDGDDMDLTEIVRRRSIALARRRSSNGARSLPPPEDLSREEESDISGSVESTQTEYMDFTLPLGQPLRDPTPPPDEWHALRAITHAGHEPVSVSEERDENDGMDLGDAMYRLRVARASLGLDGYNNDEEQEPCDIETVQDQNTSFVSTDSDSLDDATYDASDKTLNMTAILQRQSFSGSNKESTADFSSKTGQSSSHAEDARVNKTILTPTESLDEKPIYPDLFQLAPANQSSLSTKPPPVFQKSDSLYPNLSVFSKPPTADLPVSSLDAPTTASELSSIKALKPAPIAQPQRPFVFSSGTKLPSVSSPSVRVVSTPTGSSSSLKRPASAIRGNIERPSPSKKLAISRLSSNIPLGASKPAGQPPPSKKTMISPRKPSSPANGRLFSAPGTRKTPATFLPRKSFGTTPILSDGHVTGPARKVTESKGGTPSPIKPNQQHPTQQNASNALSPTSGSPRYERETIPQTTIVPISNSREPEPPQTSSSRPASPEPPSPTIPPDNVSGEYIPEVVTERVGDDAMTERWLEEVQGEGPPEDDKALISIEQFLVMTGVRFMDELAAPRRSTILPSLLSTSTSSEAGSDTLADYVVSMSVDLPQWMLYTSVSQDLQNLIDGIKEFYRNAEQDVEQDVPALFHEFAGADDEWKEEILHQLKLIKANNHAMSRSQWYDWKLYWISQLYESADTGFAKLEEDAKTLERTIKEAQEILPALRQEYEAMMRENEKEAEEVAEIEQCDQEYLVELKTSIAEQSSELDVFRAEVAETTAKLDRLKERSAEIEAEGKELRDAISDCERSIQIQKNSTKAEVFQLKEKLDALQDLHLWRATKINSDMTQFIYAARYAVFIPCVRFKPVPSKVTVSRLTSPSYKRQDPFPQLSDLTLHTAQSGVSAMKDGAVTHREILQFLSDFWTSVVQLRSQLDLLAVVYPVSVEVLDECDAAPGFKAVTSVLFTESKAKAFVNFIFDVETFSNWPMSLGSMRCEVEVAYGCLDQQRVCEAILDHFSQVSVANLQGCLLNACIGAAERA